jgi:hypothetical protein
MGWTDFIGDAVGGLGGFLKGAAGGALGGFGAAGPWGALGGGLLGGAAGAFGSNGSQQMNGQYDQYMKQFGNQQAPQMGPAAQSGNSGFRDNQRSLVTRLEAMANGQGPSLAAEQLKSATDRGMSQQASIAQSGRGNAGAANMVAANNMGRMQMQAAQDSAQGRIMESQMALNQLGGAINQGRQSDESNSQFNAQQKNFQSQGNLEAKLRAMGLSQQAIIQILGMKGQNAGAPGLGDQILAGGAGMFSFGQMQKAQQKANQQGQGQQGGSIFGQYQKNADGSTGPITSPSQV